jgi:hypothetical protein
VKKISTLFTSLIFAFAFCSVYAQKGNESLKSPQPENPSTELDPVKEKEPNKQELKKQITQIDSHLSAIETKRNYVLSDPAQKALAIEQGWFEDMKKIEKSLLKKKNELKRLIDN